MRALALVTLLLAGVAGECNITKHMHGDDGPEFRLWACWRASRRPAHVPRMRVYCVCKRHPQCVAMLVYLAIANVQQASPSCILALIRNCRRAAAAATAPACASPATCWGLQRLPTTP